MTDKMVVCYIQAYDCEKTIWAAMRSVQEQTYQNFLCFVLSNGNTGNGSFEIIKAFAASDNRFIPLNKQVNDIHIYVSMLCHLAENFPDAYICSLDADDVYLPDFFERAVALAEAHRLDIVACGTEIVLKHSAESTEEALLSRRAIEQDLIVRGADFNKRFPIYKPFFNEMWGKLYRADLLKKVNPDLEGAFLPDSLFEINCLSQCKAIGILSGTLHKFYQFEIRSATNATVIANAVAAKKDVQKTIQTEKAQKSPKVSKKVAVKRRFSVYDTYDTFMAFLRSHGKIRTDLYEYMQAVLFGWFGDYYARTLLLTTDEAVFANLAYHLVFEPKFDELMAYQATSTYNNLRNHTQRKEFCERLKYQLIGQLAIRNRVPEDWEQSCNAETRQQIASIIAKLDDTIEIMSRQPAKKKKH